MSHWPAVRAAAVGGRAIVAAGLLLTGMVLVATAAVGAEPSDATDAEEGGLSALYYQLQGLQSEVRRLQGVTEELQYRLDRLTREQRERYLELDRRLAELGLAPASDSPATSGEGTADIRRDFRRDGSPPATERAAFNAAFAAVQAAIGGAGQLSDGERTAALAYARDGFETLIRDYPNGEYTPNAFYWVGEIHFQMDNPELARQAYVQVVNLYGDHVRVPDALYKLGVVYHRLGDRTRALDYLDRVNAQYPEHTAAALARDYASELR